MWIFRNRGNEGILICFSHAFSLKFLSFCPKLAPKPVSRSGVKLSLGKGLKHVPYFDSRFDLAYVRTAGDLDQFE